MVSFRWQYSSGIRSSRSDATLKVLREKGFGELERKALLRNMSVAADDIGHALALPNSKELGPELIELDDSVRELWT